MTVIKWTRTEKVICWEPYAVSASVYTSGEWTVEPVPYVAPYKRHGDVDVTWADGRKGWTLARDGEVIGTYKTRKAAMTAVSA